MSLDGTSWDYIVIGAGSAGCVVANRLSADPSTRVLLLEAGGSDKSIFIQMPAATYVNAIGNPKFDWMYPVEADPTLGGRSNIWPRGKVLGGTSSINGMLYIRGFPQDYDGWRQLGNVGWGWDDVLPLFRRQEDNVRGASGHHGAGGPLKIADLQQPHATAKAFLRSAAACGHALLPDLNGPETAGFGFVQATQHKGWRCSAAKAFIDPVRHRRNLLVATRSLARRVHFAAGRAVAVEADIKGNCCRMNVGGEVVVCCGAIASPHLLMLSGVGDPQELERHGIAMVVERSGVGRNLQDHPGIAMTYEVSIPTYNSEMALWKKALHGANWLLRGRGAGTTPDAHVVGFVHSDTSLDLPDIQVHFTPAGYRVAGEGDLILEQDSFTVIASVCRPRSRGSIGLSSPDPKAPPAIRHRLFADPDDRDRLGRGIRAVRRIVSSAPLASLVTRPLEPGWVAQPDDATMASYLTANAGTIYHPSGTCRMGVDADSVVDPRLRLRGAQNVRIADASIMPSVTSGNLNAPCMMIGEKAAELILGDRGGGMAAR